MTFSHLFLFIFLILQHPYFSRDFMNIRTFLVLILITAYSFAAEIVVNTNSGSISPADDGLCTFFEAVNAANTNTSSGSQVGECIAGEASPVIDDIVFATEILPTTIALELPFQLTESARINGPHKELLTLSTIGLDRVGIIDNFLAADFEIRDLTISGGVAGIGTPPQEGVGGALLISLSSSSLLLERIRFENNYAEYAGGALAIAYGGTQDNTTIINNCEFVSNSTIGTLVQANGNTGGGGAIWIGGFQTIEINNSTFYSNYANNSAIPSQTSGDAMGGAIWMLSSSASAVSELTIDSSTFDGNSADGVGGAISVGGPGFPTDVSVVHIKHSTITGNQADDDSNDTGTGAGGIYSSSGTDIDLFNTIIAKNTDNSTTSNRPNLSGGFNTIGHNYMNGNSGVATEFPIGTPNANNDWIAPAIAFPQLEILDNYGGNVLTRIPQSDSPLIDKGKCTNKSSDQRGFQDINGTTRIIDDPVITNLADGCDIGATEYDAYPGNETPVAMNDTYQILEDSSIAFTSPMNLLSNDSDFENDTLYVITAGDNDISSADLSPGIVTVRADGSIEFIPESDEFGSAEFEYTISDRLSSDSSANVTITILPVNDAPQFDHDTTNFGFQSGQEGVHNFPNWASNISTGPVNESGQNFQFNIQTSGDTYIFADTPSVTNSGTLSFNLLPAITGTATISVILQDNGGTEYGGNDSSDEVIISVTADFDIIFKNSFEDLSGS